MLVSLKSMAQKAANIFGYEIHRKPKVTTIAPELEITTLDLDLYYKLYPRESIEQRRFYNIGAGLFRHKAWTNVDHVSEWYKINVIDIDFDLLSLNRLPIDSSTAEVVYSSHTIEHIINDAVQNMLNEAFRILKPKGYLRVTTPDTDLAYKAWIQNDDSTFAPEYLRILSGSDFRTFALNKPLSQATNIQKFLNYIAGNVSELHLDSPARRISNAEVKEIFSRLPYEEALSYCISRVDLPTQKKYVGHHINWFNEHKLTDMFKKAGFQEVYRSGFGQSLCPILRDMKLFDNHPEISLYIEARK